MLRKKDVILILVLLLAAAGLYGAMLASRSGQQVSGVVDVYVDGALFARETLGTTHELRVEGSDGAVNVLGFDAQGVWMEHSTCKNQLCLEQGKVSVENWQSRAMGRSLICLPNRVVVELALSDTQEPAGEDIPDV